ncbi:MAG: succinylglutamate desuccinylase/aspartoacylase family protein [Methanobacteriaceae archaeon]|jgi:predicted deacylase|nr:succinylglutamate desuccinylase/aspartoacylase family protein [Candidatus Methanorudis spinitermitis]
MPISYFNTKTVKKISEKILNTSKKKLDFNIRHISKESGGYISANPAVFDNIPNTISSKKVLREAIKGTPLIKFGDGGVSVMIISGIHGNELPPQIASLILINELENIPLNGTVYIIPFSAPKATMYNSRWFDSDDLNRVANIDGSLSNSIMKIIKELKIISVADFHSTAPNSNPGKEGIFCTMKPSPESYHIGKYISNKTHSEILSYDHAGSAYQGAIEDECNILNIPAVTCEVLCPNGSTTEEAYKKSLKQMKYFLSYFDIISFGG